MSTTSGGPNNVTNGLVLHLDAGSLKSFKGIPTTNFLSNPTQILTTNEFGQYYNLAPIFDTNGLVPYSLSFDMKVNKNGSVLVYMQNGSYTKYDFVYQSVNATTEYQRFKFENITPSGPTAGWQANTPTDNRAMLATYTTYGSGVIPTLTNFQLELGSVATPFVIGTRGTTVATGGGWADRTSNAYHGELVNGPTYNATNGGRIVFDGVDDYIDLGSNLQLSNNFTLCVWHINPNTGYIIDQGNIGEDPTNSLEYTNYGLTLSANNISSVTADGTITTTKWNFISTTFSSATTKFYINGILDSTKTASFSSFTPSGKLKIGRRAFNTSSIFSGSIGMVMIYNRVLTDSEILQNYNAQKSRFGLP
jgi:hypothetical protein